MKEEIGAGEVLDWVEAIKKETGWDNKTVSRNLGVTEKTVKNWLKGGEVKTKDERKVARAFSKLELLLGAGVGKKALPVHLSKSLKKL